VESEEVAPLPETKKCPEMAFNSFWMIFADDHWVEWQVLVRREVQGLMEGAFDAPFAPGVW
jgi:hypothetical protein